MLTLPLEMLSGFVVVIVLCVLAMGAVYDRTEQGARQRIALGLVAGAACLVALAVAGGSGPAAAAGAIAMVLTAGLFACGLAALVAAIPAIAAIIGVDGLASLHAAFAVFAAGVLGTGVRAFLLHRQRSVERKTVLVVAALGAPLLAFPLAGFTEGTAVGIGLDAAWLGFSCALCGLLVYSERIRSGAGREERGQTALLRETRQISPEMMETQLRHHWHLHDRYGVQYAYMVVALDDAPALRRLLSPTAWQALRTQIARTIRETVRDCDICSPVDPVRTGILLPYIGPAAMARVAVRIRDAVAGTDFRLVEPVSVSVGMAHVDEVNGPDDMCVIADDALVVARSATPRGAVGPPRPGGDDGPAPLIRAFPGLILSPAPARVRGKPLAMPEAVDGFADDLPSRKAA